MNDSSNDFTDNDIAIVGMACRFPGANTPNAFWENLQSGSESLTSLSDKDLLASGVSKDLLANPNYVKSGMFLEDHDAFDAEFFGFSPLDAKILDPQHRHFLECSWEAFEDSGYVPGEIDGAVGVFAGSGYNAYLSQNLLPNKDLLKDVGLFLLRHTGNDKDFLATRVSYLLNLQGPSVNVQTACSTSLVAVHMAVQSLLNSECDMAIAGGVTIDMPHKQGYLYKESEILSPDGHCRPFDSQSKGTVFGSGVGCVLLKRYDDAIADGDNIHAVVKGTAVNNDGSEKVSYLAPSVDGQIAAMQDALDIAEIAPETVSYIECHGTGTQLGDPIEIAAIAQAYDSDEPTHSCGIGSVKSNIGHTDTAAGIASLIKVVQSLKNKKLAPTLHFTEANPAIDFENSPLYVNAKLTDWESHSPRRAGVSSLGVGGTNAHVILQEADQPQSSTGSNQQLIMLSANSELSLQKYRTALSDYASQSETHSLHDISHTLATGRKHFRYRAFAIVDGVDELRETLDSQDSTTMVPVEAPKDQKKLAMMFAGGGTQHVNMGRELYDTEAVYRDSVNQCLQLLEGIVDFDLKDVLYPDAEPTENQMVRPSRGLPALFVTQYAQARLWQSWGVTADAMIGHSMGENTAACLAGVFSLQDALGLVALRGKLFEAVERGGMISVSISSDELQQLTTPLQLDIAASNAPELSVASGSRDKLDQLETILKSRDIDYQAIHIDVAAHSRMLVDILEPFREYLTSITLNTAEVPFISNLTGTWITAEQAASPDYWVDHLRSTVMFEEGAKTLLAEQEFALLEVGPGRTLASLTRMQASARESLIESSMPHIEDTRTDRQAMLNATGQLWQVGISIDHSARYSDCRKISLPTYQFAKTKHWVDAEQQPTSVASRAESVASFQYQPVWQRIPTKNTDYREALDGKTVMLLAGANSLNTTIIRSLNETRARLVIVSTSEDNPHTSGTSYKLDPRDSNSYQTLITTLSETDQLPDFVIHSLALDSSSDISLSNSYNDLQSSFHSLFQLTNSIVNGDMNHDMKWLILTQGAQQVSLEETGNPLQAIIHSSSSVISSECSNINCSSLDLPLNATPDSLAPILLRKLTDNTTSNTAYRGSSFFEQSFLPITQAAQSHTDLDSDALTNSRNIRDHGTYLITGGTGGLGLIAAQTLASEKPVNLVLISRTALPPRDHWQELAKEDNLFSKLQLIESNGSTVTHLCADIAKLADVEKLKSSIASTLGDVHGIIHTAGVVNDNLIALKTGEDCTDVLKPKVLGTLNLNEVFDLDSMDFVVLYSSISSFIGLPGQIDYAAANAFLDSFANHFTGRGNVSSINWPAWKEDGMAARMLTPEQNNSNLHGIPAEHPLLDVCSVDRDSQLEYRSRLSVQDNWMLDEHRMSNGTALIPGSGFIEIARAAFSEATGNKVTSISNAMFLEPFAVSDEQSKELIVKLDRKDEQCFDFTISSLGNAAEVIHATGTVGIGQTHNESLSIDDLKNRCKIGTQSFDDEDHHPNLKFGDRWSSLRTVHIGTKEALIDLSLNDEYSADLNHYALHPAMLDMATGGAQALIPQYQPQTELYVPVEYGELNLIQNFPARAHSHVTLKFHDAEMGTAVFDVTVTDQNGTVFLSVKDFTMQRLAQTNAISIDTDSTLAEVNPLLNRTIELGIYSEEGSELLLSIINDGHLPQRIISSHNPEYVIGELRGAQSGLSARPQSQSRKAEHDPEKDKDIPAIESTLSEIDAIETIIIRSHLNEDGTRKLVAHYKVDDWESITVSELRKYARNALDNTCVPQHFVEIDELPEDDTGKLDRTALLDPYAPIDRHVAPRTPVEQGLAEIWAEVLGTEKVSVNDNFFDIGGHSLLSIRVIVKAQKKFSVQLDQAQMVLLTLEQQANQIQQQLPGSESLLHPAQLQQTTDSSSSSARV